MAKKRLKKRPVEKDTLVKKRLELEIREREWNVSWWGKVSKLSPLFTPLVVSISILMSVYWYTVQWELQTEQQSLETERQRQETITNLKREFASENLSIRIAAALALAEYPKEAIPVLITSLGEGDTAFIDAIKRSLRQIGKDAIKPLAEELRRLQAEVTVIFEPSIRIKRRIGEIPLRLPEFLITPFIFRDFSVDELLNKPLEDIRNKLKSSLPEIMDEEIDSIITKLDRIRSSRPELAVANKNGVEVLTYLLRHHHINNLLLSGIDLSGANLMGANLSEAYLMDANLSGAYLERANLSSSSLLNTYLSSAWLTKANLASADLERANLSNAYLQYADLSDAELTSANLSGASLVGANLSGASLWVDKRGTLGLLRSLAEPFGFKFELGVETILAGADFRRAKLHKVNGFRDVKDFSDTNLKGVEGLSEEDLAYAKSKGAITD